MNARPAPSWSVSRWFNADALTLESLRGRPVFLHAFQMLCPGCVQHAVPQSLKVAEAFANTDLAVVTNGTISVTPLRLDLTDGPTLKSLRAQFA